MAIGDYLSYLNPTNYNVFGVDNPTYSGLLGPEQSKALSQRSNIAGLLGAAAALAQGMSKQGPRRSGLQNVIGALGAGYGSAGQAYQGGIEQMANAQKLAQLKLQMEQNAQTQQAVNNLLQDPAIANDPSAIAYIRSNPADAIKQYAEIRAFQRQREQYMPQGAVATPSPAAPSEAGMAPVTVSGNKEIGNLERQINESLADAAAYRSMRKPTEAEASVRMAEKLRERQLQVIAGDIDIKGRIEKAPEQFKAQYQAIADIKDTLKPDQILTAIQRVDTAVLESGKQYKFDGIAGNYAVTQFGTNDQTKLTPDQNRNVLAYANAPTQADQTKIAIDAQKLKFETGAAPALPRSREEMLQGTAPAVAPSAQPAPVVQPTQARVVTPRAAIPPMEQPPAPIVARELQRTGEAAPEIKPTTTSVQIPKGTIPLINQPDNKVTPKRKQELIAAQPATIALVNYTASQLVDARDAAQALLNSPKELKAISGFTGPAMAIAPGTDAYTGAAKLENLQTRSFVSEIQKMRAASPTGGAVGSVTEKEMAALSNIQASLKAGLKEDVLRKQLKQYIDSANFALKTIPIEYARTYGYQGEFEDILSRNVVQKQPSGLPSGVTVKRK
jgi:hypothetical protein